MSDNENQNYSEPVTIDEPINSFLVVHIHNKSDTYHLTRQVLLDSTLTKNSYCFFYHILSLNMDSFNKMYGLFACLIPRDDSEADLYLNVDSDALAYVITYIQTGKNDIKNSENVEKYADLASVFGMSELVSILRDQNNINSTDQTSIDFFRNLGIIYLMVTPEYLYSYDRAKNLVDNYVDKNKEIILNHIRDKFL